MGRFKIDRLGEAKFDSPIVSSFGTEGYNSTSEMSFVDDDDFVSYAFEKSMFSGPDGLSINTEDQMEKAGPRRLTYFNPHHTHIGIISCGGLCPGINTVIRSIVRTACMRYGVKSVIGIPFGYRGFDPTLGADLQELTPEVVDHIHLDGGSILGTARGWGEKTVEVADGVERMNLNMLFIIGGDGTQRAAYDLSKEIKKRGLRVSLVGIPKTIDNDISYLSRSFGFQTAVTHAVDAVSSAHVEASSAINGIGLVKVMGRDAGFIAATTTLASNDVNFCLIPEVPFTLEGDRGLFHQLAHRLRSRHHVVIILAEGAGQELMGKAAKDKFGYGLSGDIGLFLKEKVTEYFKEKAHLHVNLKYIDPSYMIRSSRPIPMDALYCTRLGANAVHAAMAGKTNMIVSLWNDQMCHVPMKLVAGTRSNVDPSGQMWQDVLENTGQLPVLLDSPSSAS